MTQPVKPSRRPERPLFSSGPTAKRPGWSPDVLSSALLGRANRAPATLARVQEGLDLSREILGVPKDYVMTCLPGSDTGAVEAAMWSLLGARKTQVLSFENFGQTWAQDAVDHLKLDAEILSAPYGGLPDLSRVDPACDLVFPWNGTTSGVRVPNGDFISDNREGLVICDATSAAFCMDLPWRKLDVVTFSFQKAMGGEAGVGVAIFSPRAITRLNTFDPGRPIPKVLRLKKGLKADMDVLTGTPINTYSLMVAEDFLDALRWALREGGLPGLIRRTEANFNALATWVARTPWIDFLAEDPATVSTTSVCLKFTAPEVATLSDAGRQALVKRICTLIEREGAGYDLAAYRAAPPGLRVWCGCTVDASDVEALTPWIDWAYLTAVSEQTVAA